MQIGREYPVADKEKTIQILTEFLGIKYDDALTIVANNLVEGKRYDEALELCETLQSNSPDGKRKRMMEQRINGCKYADVIKYAIENDYNEEIFKKVFAVIESDVNKGIVNFSSIQLAEGTTGKTITLNDLWGSTIEVEFH